DTIVDFSHAEGDLIDLSAIDANGALPGDGAFHLAATLDKTVGALAISGKIGSASASWFRDRLSEARLAAGDAVLLSSQGGALNQAAIM
ncbi:type I secretion C-terminal target domain-containing protein, partial [Acinetobacter baumannii]